MASRGNAGREEEVDGVKAGGGQDGDCWCGEASGKQADGKTGERHPLHLNRDVNAACNMVQIYYGLLATGERPKCFCV